MTPPASPHVSPRARWAVTGLVFVGFALAFHLLYRRFPVLYDGDAYYHLAVAREYGERGIIETLDWARFSVMHDGFGDKDFLFHALLVPFARAADPTAGGFLALALLDGVVAALLAWAGVRAIGLWGVVVPLLAFGTSMDFALRMVRLRPELLSLVLILAAVLLAASGRTALLAVVACLYALAYTAFEALLGLCGLFFAYVLWVERRTEWRLVLLPAAGVALGLLIHPHFPANLRVWVIQNLDFFMQKGSFPDVGAEIQSRSGRDLLVLNLGWWMSLLVLWRSRRTGDGTRTPARARDFTIISSAVFCVFYLLMARFVTYFVPLATLALVQSTGVPGRFTRLPWRGHVPFGLALSLCFLLTALTLPETVQRTRQAAARIFRPEMRPDWEAFARALPDGARVFAPWAATGPFAFWAPRALYLNVLDPIFMVARDRDAYLRHLDVLEGREPDIPLVARSRFDSDFYADDGQYPLARTRLVRDPRVAPLHEGITYLYRFVERQNGGFLLDWKVLPAGAPVPPPVELVDDPATPTYPRAATARERELEGYVDGRRLGSPEGCVAFAHLERVDRPTRVLLEIAPYGTAEVYVDDGLTAVVPPRAAVLGRGMVLAMPLEPGIHRLTIRTCAAEGHLGFYALRR